MRVQTIYRIVVTRLALKETQKELPYPEFSYLNLPNLKVPKSYKITYQIHFELVLRTAVFMYNATKKFPSSKLFATLVSHLKNRKIDYRFILGSRDMKSTPYCDKNRNPLLPWFN